jgi:hypothetical protein
MRSRRCATGSRDGRGVGRRSCTRTKAMTIAEVLLGALRSIDVLLTPRSWDA